MAIRVPHLARLGTLLTVAVACLAVTAGLLVAATPTAALPARTAALPARTALESAIADAVLKLINTERALHALPSVHMAPRLQVSARHHDVRMANDNEMSHQLPGEPWFGQRFENAGYYWSYAGENIGWNSDMSKGGVLFLQRLMYNEKPPNDGHRLNILDRHYYNVGVDVYLDHVNHKVWLTTDFGHH